MTFFFSCCGPSLTLKVLLLFENSVLGPLFFSLLLSSVIHNHGFGFPIYACHFRSFSKFKIYFSEYLLSISIWMSPGLLNAMSSLPCQKKKKYRNLRTCHALFFLPMNKLRLPHSYWPVTPHISHPIQTSMVGTYYIVL